MKQIGDDVQLSHVVAVGEAAGDLKKDSAGTDLAAGDVIYGAMKNGVELYIKKWGGDNSTERLIGEYGLDFTSGTGTRITDASLTDGQKESLKGKSFTVPVAVEGNAVVLAATALTPAANGLAKDAASSPTITIKFNDAGDGIDSTNCTVSNPYFAVRASSSTGLESSDHTGDKIKVTTGEYTPA